MKVFTARTRALALFVALAALLAVGIGSQSALAGSTTSDPGVFAPNAHPYGQSYSQWAADWWRWALSQPAASNALFDSTGAQCANNQHGRVWFLVGTTGGAANRTCTVPQDKAILIPVLNNVFVAFAFDPLGVTPPDPPEQRTEAFVRAGAHFTGTGLSATIDGVPVSNVDRYLERSSLFKVTLPGGNIFGLSPGFVLDPCADEGYYLVIKPLSPGTHTIRVGGAFVGGTAVAATYRISVPSTGGDEDGGDH